MIIIDWINNWALSRVCKLFPLHAELEKLLGEITLGQWVTTKMTLQQNKEAQK